LLASSASAASEVGGLLAVGASALTVASMSEASLASWGWRIPFLFGAALAASVGIARSMMHESPEFVRQQDQGTVPEVPLRHALTHHRGAIARSFTISALGSITYYVGITYVPAFLTSVGSLSERESLWLSTAAAVIVILVTPFAGIWSDRAGRRLVLILLSLASAALPIAMFSLMASGARAQALMGALVLAAVAGAYSAVGAVATAEQFPGEGRVTGLALGATGATAVFGGLTPFAAQWLVERTGWTTAPGIMIGAVALCVLPVFLKMRETAPLGPSRNA
jgi:MHS family proline/betaine transporter-like MFS transporter